MFINPGYAGMREGICINGLMRQQWAGFKDYETGETFISHYDLTLDGEKAVDMIVKKIKQDIAKRSS